MARLRARIVGQAPVLDAMEDMLRVVKADIGDPHRPLAVNLFMGPTGVGKTETVRLISEAIHGRADGFCRIDMNTLAQEHYAAALTGAPPGYVGSKEGHTLFDVDLIQGSFSKPGIVLFDELEKASTEVIRSLLNVLESGRLLLSGGTRSIDFRNTLIFMTSNVGAREAGDYRARFQQGWRHWLGLSPRHEDRVLERALHRRFDPEFINRVDRVLPFQRLDAAWLDTLLDIELGKLNQRLARRDARLELDNSARQFLCRAHDDRFGARDLARRLRAELEPALARALLDRPADDTFLALLDGDRLSVVPVNR
ncbi:MAG TPA: AAA family ATPase [Alcanivorax sp.]|nr:AAA family ATPase [Alcanivorax sp.]